MVENITPACVPAIRAAYRPPESSQSSAWTPAYGRSKVAPASVGGPSFLRQKLTKHRRAALAFDTPSGVRKLGDEYKRIRRKLENAWHEHGWAKWTNDPDGMLRTSTEVRQRPPARTARNCDARLHPHAS